MSLVDINYMRAELSVAQKEGAKVFSVRVNEMHHLLSRIAELEKLKAEKPEGLPTLVGYASADALDAMRLGGSMAVRVQRRKGGPFRHAMYAFKTPDPAPEVK